MKQPRSGKTHAIDAAERSTSARLLLKANPSFHRLKHADDAFGTTCSGAASRAASRAGRRAKRRAHAPGPRPRLAALGAGGVRLGVFGSSSSRAAPPGRCGLCQPGGACVCVHSDGRTGAPLHMTRSPLIGWTVGRAGASSPMGAGALTPYPKFATPVAAAHPTPLHNRPAPTARARRPARAARHSRRR